MLCKSTFRALHLKELVLLVHCELDDEELSITMLTLHALPSPVLYSTLLPPPKGLGLSSHLCEVVVSEQMDCMQVQRCESLTSLCLSVSILQTGKPW